MGEDESYGTEHIVVLEGIEAIRKRPGMYVGDTQDGSGLHHLLWEVLANAVDEHLRGYATRVHVTLEADGSVVVDDDGRGMAPELIEPALTRLHASGGLGEQLGQWPHVHLAAHGVGMVAAQALSAHFELASHHRGTLYRARFAEGRLLDGPREAGGTRRSGTRVRFLPDANVFTPARVDGDAVRQKLWDIACFNPALEVGLGAERFRAPRGGVEDVCRRIEALGRPAASPVLPDLVAKGHHLGIGVDVALGWVPGTKTDIRSFVSQVPSRRGTHIDGLFEALRALHPSLSAEAARARVAEGLVAWVYVSMLDPCFGAPTRDWLTSPEAQVAVAEVVQPRLRDLPEPLRQGLR